MALGRAVVVAVAGLGSVVCAVWWARLGFAAECLAVLSLVAVGTNTEMQAVPAAVQLVGVVAMAVGMAVTGLGVVGTDVWWGKLLSVAGWTAMLPRVTAVVQAARVALVLGQLLPVLLQPSPRWWWR